MRTISALAVATAASLYGLYGPTFVPEPPASTATSIEQVQPASSFTVSSVPATSPSDENSVQTSTSEVTVTATTLPSVSIGWNGKCVEWWSTAVRMGWPEELLPTLGEVMWNESRCQSDAHNTGSGDYGLTQINWGYHAQRTAQFGFSRNDLYVPAVNLMIAYDIYLDALETSPSCGWWPWNASGNYCGGRS